ncbi:tetratricopeptide repeat protein [Actinosynnema sp. NPDC051121]
MGRLRAHDQRHGGGRCVDEAVGRLPAALALLERTGTARIGHSLRTAVADLHNAAGWVCFDTGRTGEALRHLRTALTVAGDDEALVSNIHYRLGRVHLHHDAPRSALSEFRSAERAARASGSALALAVVVANQAWAHAKLGSSGHAVALLDEAADHHSRARGEPVAPWAAFFTDVELAAIGGVVRAEPARTDPAEAGRAVSLLTSAVDGFGPDRARSRTASLISLAVCHLLAGRVDTGTRLGEQAVDLCQTLQSARTTERLGPLQYATRGQPAHRGALALAVRIHRLRVVDAVHGWPAGDITDW